MSDARQIAEKAARERLSMVFNDYAQRTDTMLYSALVALLSGAYHEELIKGERHTAALEAKERELAIAGQCLMEERDTYKAQLDEAVRLLQETYAPAITRYSPEADEIDEESLEQRVNAFLDRVKGGKS